MPVRAVQALPTLAAVCVDVKNTVVELPAETKRESFADQHTLVTMPPALCATADIVAPLSVEYSTFVA